MIGLVGVLAIVVIAGLAVLGAWRGLRREALVTLVGVVPGALLGYFWNQDWAPDLADDYRGIILLASLFFVTIALGYGSSVWLPRHRQAWWERLAGAGVGLVNGVALAGFSFRYVHTYFYRAAADSPLRVSLIAAALMDYLPWVFAALVILCFAAIVTVALVRLFRFIHSLVQAPEEGSSPAVPAAPADRPKAAAPGPPEAAPAAAEGLAPSAAQDEEVTVPCPNCGKPVPFGAAYCPQCGKIIG